MEGTTLVDALLDRTIDVDDTTADVARRLDGATPWPAVRDAVIALGHDGDDADTALRSLMLLHHVEGAGDELTARLVRVVGGEEAVSTSILAGARFACQGSGACCSAYSFGPLTDGDVARLDGLDLATAFPGLTPPFVDEREGARYLRKRGDRCAFLADDHRCGLHRAFGAEAKPHFCRLYPLEAFATVDGLRIVDRGTCATFGVSARRGLPLVDDLPRVHALLDPPVLHHPAVVVDRRAWDYGLYLRFTRAALDLADRDGEGALACLGAAGRCLDALSMATDRCPLEPGQPDATVDALLALDGALWFRPPRPAAAARGLQALATLVEALSEAVGAAIERGEGAASTPVFREFRAAAAPLAAALRAEVEPGPAPRHADDVEEALRLSLRQQLFGQHAHVGGHAGIGLVRIGLVHVFALAGARAQAGARPLAAADLGRGHSIANRTFHSHVVDEVLTDADGDWRELLDGLAPAARAVDRV